MKITEIKAKLKELGIPYAETDSKNKLMALLPTEEPATLEEGIVDSDESSDDEVPTPAAPKETPAPVVEGIKVMVGGKVVRVYTEHLHGENARAYAQEYADKIRGTVVS